MKIRLPNRKLKNYINKQEAGRLLSRNLSFKKIKFRRLIDRSVDFYKYSFFYPAVKSNVKVFMRVFYDYEIIFVSSGIINNYIAYHNETGPAAFLINPETLIPSEATMKWWFLNVRYTQKEWFNEIIRFYLGNGEHNL